MENENTKNELNIIEVDGHPTRTAPTGIIRLKIGEGKEFPSLRVIELPNSFIEQEFLRWRKHKPVKLDQESLDTGTKEIALLNMWFFVFEPMPLLKPTKIPILDRMFEYNKRFERGGSFYLDAKEIVKSAKNAVEKMEKYIERAEGIQFLKYQELERGKNNKAESLIDLFCRAQGFQEKDMELSQEEIDWILNKFVEVYEKIGSEFIKAGRKNLEQIVKRTKENYFFRALRRRFLNEREHDLYLQTIGRRLENVWIHMLDNIANNFAEKLKSYVNDKELKLFELLNTRQEFWGNRIFWYDLKRGLLNIESIDKELKLTHLITLVKIYGIKNLNNHNFEAVLNKAVDNYLKIIGYYRFMAPGDEQDLPKGLSLDETISPDSNNPTSFKEMLVSSDDIELNYQIRKLYEEVKALLPPELVQILEMCRRGLKQKEIAVKMGCKQPYISRALKEIIPKKLKESGFTKEDLHILYKEPISSRYTFLKKSR